MKKTIVLLTMLLCLIALFGCTNRIKELTIVAEDVKDVPAGDYTLQYTVTDYETYREAYELQLSVNVYDENNRSITVTNNRTVKLEAEKTYTVIIRLTGNVKGKDISKYKQYTIETIKSDHVVSFILKDGDITLTQTTCTVKNGDTIPMEEVPEIQKFYAAQNDLEGHSRTIISSKWVYYDENGNAHDLTQEYLTNVTKDLNVYSLYAYNDVLIEYTVKFDTNGGEAYPDQTGTVEKTLYRPADPVKNGYVFLGWCTDKARTTYYNWRKEQSFAKNMTLYAAWATDNSAQATPDSYFDFTELSDNYGNPYFKLSVKDKARLSGDLVLPSCHAGKPVRDLVDGAFSHSDITSVYIPATYTLKIARAFSFCSKLETATFEKSNLRDNLDVFVFSNCAALKSIVLPDRLVTLDEGCLSGCILLESIALPDTVQVINEKAFFDCKSIKAIVLPDSVQHVYANAFSGCDALETVTVEKTSSLQEISSSAFNGTAIKNLLLPNRLNGQISLENSEITITYYSAETQTEQ